MKFNAQAISETVNQGDIYTLTNLNKEEFYTLRTWARSKGFIISKFEPEITIKLRKAKDSKGSVSSWIFKELARKEAAQDFSSLDVWDTKTSYLRTIMSRYNRISSVKWKVREIRSGRCLIYKDIIDLSTIL